MLVSRQVPAVVGSESKLSNNQRSEALANQVACSIPIESCSSPWGERLALIQTDYRLLDTADRVFAYRKEMATNRFLVSSQLINEEQGLTVEETSKICFDWKAYRVPRVFEKQILSPWDAFCIGITINLFAKNLKMKSYKTKEDCMKAEILCFLWLIL